MSEWIGVDLDGTLAEYGGWQGPDNIGPPIPAMLGRVKGWLEEGVEVRIVTARACVPEQIPPVEEWLEEHVGVKLAVTHEKDFDMVELWDDRAVRVLTNQGEPCCNSALARAERAEARDIDLTEHLKEILEIAHEHGGEDGGEDGVTCQACHRILALADSALALSPSPVAEAMARVVEAVGGVLDEVPVAEFDGRATTGIESLDDALDELDSRMDALRAARKGEGE